MESDYHNDYKDLMEHKKRQLQRLAEIKRNKEGGSKSTGPPAITSNTEDVFGVPDELEFLKNNTSDGSPGVHPEATNILKDQIRSLRDENGRLYKLLGEKDFEIRSLQNKSRSIEQPSSLSSLAPDAATAKVMELSKKVRELTAEMESERNKSSQMRKKIVDLENEVKRSEKQVNVSGKGELDDSELRQLRQTAKESEKKITELKFRNQSLNSDLKKALKALGDEIGDPNVNVHSILNSSSSWRGRQQQIVALKDKVRVLERQLLTQQSQQQPSDTNSTLSAASSLGRDTFRLDDSPSLMTYSFNNSNQAATTPGENNLFNLQRQRREFAEKYEADLRQAQADNESMHKKLEASRARITVLQNEVKTLKEQTKQLLEKGHHDDELITALIKQQKALKETLEDTLKLKATMESSAQDEITKISQQQESESRVVTRLTEIIRQKEEELVALHHLVGQSNNQKLPSRSQDESVVRVVEERFSQTSRPNTATFRQSDVFISDTNANSKGGTDMLMGQFKACEVERDKLRELNGLMSRRNEEILSRSISMEKEILSLRKYILGCEKALNKHRIPLPQSAILPPSQPTTIGTTNAFIYKSSPHDDDDCYGHLLEELAADVTAVPVDFVRKLQQALNECVDEIQSLRYGLQNVLASKKEDLKMVTEIMNETREQYLLAMKQLQSS